MAKVPKNYLNIVLWQQKIFQDELLQKNILGGNNFNFCRKSLLVLEKEITNSAMAALRDLLDFFEKNFQIYQYHHFFLVYAQIWYTSHCPTFRKFMNSTPQRNFKGCWRSIFSSIPLLTALKDVITMDFQTFWFFCIDRDVSKTSYSDRHFVKFISTLFLGYY